MPPSAWAALKPFVRDGRMVPNLVAACLEKAELQPLTLPSVGNTEGQTNLERLAEGIHLAGRASSCPVRGPNGPHRAPFWELLGAQDAN